MDGLTSENNIFKRKLKIRVHYQTYYTANVHYSHLGMALPDLAGIEEIGNGNSRELEKLP